ncbi:PadR family transcriptional regulator [Microbispora sp. NPDC049125]|uniref:PadR family transcriptional regulator n=1 Tax=Microbispora sp. NPDC049125 TaxID=3154929 RepID=UPI0034651918
MSLPRPRLTMTTRLVLDELADAAPHEALWGYSICRTTGLLPGTVYPILARLERIGWVASGMEPELAQGRPRRRIYVLTAAARRQYEDIRAARAKSA